MKKIKIYTKYNKTHKPIVFVLVFALIGAAGAGIYSNKSVFNTDVTTDAATPGIPIIDTNYTIPAPQAGKTTRYVGTNETYNTLQSAISASQDGDVIVVKAKTDGSPYREGKLGLSKNVTIVGNPGDQVWFDGTVDATTGYAGNSWIKNANGNYELVWYTPDFCSAVNDNASTTGIDERSRYYEATGANLSTLSNGVPEKDTLPCAHEDMSLNSSYPLAWDPQAVFTAENTSLKQVATEAEITDNTKFYYKRSGTTSKIVINFLPSQSNKVEITKFPSFMVMTATSTATNKITVQGIGIRKYATSQHESGNFNGTIYANPDYATFKNIVVWKNSGSGLRVTNSSSNVSITNSIFKENGYNGLNADKSPNILFFNNIVALNNDERFGDNCQASCGHAGVKMAHLEGGTISNNLFDGNKGHGYWCDLSCNYVKVVKNVMQNNTKSGIFYEVSNNGIIASNLLIGDAQGIRVASPNTKIYNNTTLPNGGSGVFLQQDKRLGTSGFPSAFANTVAVNNIIKGGIQITVSSGTYTTSNNDLVNNNENSFFVNPNGDNDTGNYNLLTTSSAYASGSPIPSDVASAIQDPISNPINKGALYWYDKPSALSATDTTVPTISLISPTEGSSVSGVITLKAIAKDNVALSSIQFFIFGNPNPIATITNISGDSTVNKEYSVSWNSTNAKVGSRIMYAVATDSSDNTAESSRVNITVVAPTIVGDIAVPSDSKVNVFDLSTLLSKWNTSETTADINKDGTVGIIDLSMLLTNWTG